MPVKRNCNHATCQGPVCRRPKKKTIRKPISRFSKMRETENRKYSTVRKQFLEENPVCEFPDCNKESTDVHHSRGRGIYFLDVKTWKALCREHHQRIEVRVNEAKQLGLSESRLTK
jgi:hypothetical protein